MASLRKGASSRGQVETRPTDWANTKSLVADHPTGLGVRSPGTDALARPEMRSSGADDLAVDDPEIDKPDPDPMDIDN